MFSSFAGHPSCFGLTSDALKEIDETKWECSRCKICVVCGVKTEHVSFGIRNSFFVKI